MNFKKTFSNIFFLIIFSITLICFFTKKIQAQNETEEEKKQRLKREKFERDRRRVDSIRNLSDYDKARSLDTMRWVFKIAPLGLIDVFNPNIKIGAEYLFHRKSKPHYCSWSPEIGVGFPLGISTISRKSGRSMSVLPLNYRTFWFNNEFRVYRGNFTPSYTNELNSKERYYALELQSFYRTFDVEGIDSVTNIRGEFAINQLIFVLNAKKGIMFPYRNVYFDFYYGLGLRFVNEFHKNPLNLKEDDLFYVSGFHRKGDATGASVMLNISLGVKIMFFAF